MGADADGMGAGVMGADAGVMGAAADAEALSVASWSFKNDKIKIKISIANANCDGKDYVNLQCARCCYTMNDMPCMIDTINPKTITK